MPCYGFRPDVGWSATMILTELQRKTVQAMVNIFETSAVLGRYAQVTLIPGDTGGLTYGRSQTTINSGNLLALLDAYAATPGALLPARLQPFRPQVVAMDPALGSNAYFRNLLRAAADDPVMRAAQDTFFDMAYFDPAFREANRLGLATALGMAAVYDGFVHGSWAAMRNRANAHGALAAVGEPAWIDAYVTERRNWLANHNRADLRATTYRMDEMRTLINRGDWALNLPMVVRGLEISLATLSGTAPGVFSGPPPGSRSLAVSAPLLRGLDARLLQLELSNPAFGGRNLSADGIYGSTTAVAVSAFRGDQGMGPGPADIAVFQTLQIV